MRKKDSIFWIATGIFILGLVLSAITQKQFWIALGVGAYLLRPTLASLGAAKRNVDERQMSIHYRSGNIGFAVLLFICVIFMARLETEGNHAFEFFATAIILGLAAKALFNVILVKNYRQAASKIIVSAGLMIALFSALDAGSFVGTVMSILPGLAIVGVGLLSRKYPRPIGIVVFVLTALIMIVILRRITWGQIVTAVVIGVPLITAGVCLIIGNRSDAEVEPKSPA